MAARTRVWLVLSAVVATALLASLAVAGWYLSTRMEPFVRERLVAFLSSRFDGDVALKDLEVSMPVRDPLRILLNKGRGARVTVEASGVVLRQRGAREGYPLLEMRGLTFDFDASRLFDSPAAIDLVEIDGLELAGPPKAERMFTSRLQGPSRRDADGSKTPRVVTDRVVADGATVAVLPRDPDNAPLRFDLDRLALHSAGADPAMRHVTTLRNAKPPGVVQCRGTFGPYDATEPGETPITGAYSFRRADLAGFKGIAGLLDSSGTFGGRLNEIFVDGQATVPRTPGSKSFCGLP